MIAATGGEGWLGQAAEWPVVFQVGLLGLLTLVQEDLPALGAAGLAASGRLPWGLAGLGVGLGIWLGDVLLYALARGFGRRLVERPWLRRRLDPARVARSEQWFAAHGMWVLWGSRFLPGTRLPTYLAAGFLRVPWARFLTVTGMAALVWVGGIFGLTRWLGDGFSSVPTAWGTRATWVVAALLMVRVGWAWPGARLGPGASRRLRTWCGRWRRWEFWPAWLFYLPVVANYLWLAMRYRSLTLPTAANPGIFSGGIVGESKIATLRELMATSPEFTAEARLLEGKTEAERLDVLARWQAESGTNYPLVLKPDVGQRGVGVKLIRSVEQATAYVRSSPAPVLAQRYVPGPREAGVFYFRHPRESRGRILAITEKVFPEIVGDGCRTIEELIWDDPRARFVAGVYLRRWAARRKEVLPAGAALRLVEAGNHAQGCIFRDGSDLWTPELEARIDDISRRLTGFCVGRYDIRFESEKDFRSGRRFEIVELNGAASEATHVYDARNSLVSAYRSLFRQWALVFSAGAANRDAGAVPTPAVVLWKKWREAVDWTARYPVAD